MIKYKITYKKAIVRLFTVYVISFILGSFLFISFFHSFLFSHIDILFYRGILLLVVSSSVLCVGLLVFKNSNFNTFFMYRDIITLISIFFSFWFVFFTLIPVTLERSVSIFMLGTMNNSSKKVFTEKEMTEIFYKKYIQENKAINKRFYEQIVSGNIIQKKNGYKISTQGEKTIKLFQVIGAIFNIKPK